VVEDPQQPPDSSRLHFLNGNILKSAIAWSSALIDNIFSNIISEPPEPRVPDIVKKEKDQIVIRISPTSSENGPITSYQIIVDDARYPSNFHPELLKSYSEAQRDGVAYYIAAEITPQVSVGCCPVR
jgi:hypothetical protein